MKLEEYILSNLKNFYADTEDVSSFLEDDYESEMAKSQIKSVVQNSYEIYSNLQNVTDLPSWVQSKITLAADYITTVNDYFKGIEHD
jgi:ribulose kinase